MDQVRQADAGAHQQPQHAAAAGAHRQTRSHPQAVETGRGECDARDSGGSGAPGHFVPAEVDSNCNNTVAMELASEGDEGATIVPPTAVICSCGNYRA